VDFLLGVASTVLEQKLTEADVIGAYAGLRPLIEMPGAKAGARSADLSRKHAVLESPDGVITVVGGKLTTYRRMAADAVDAAVRRGGLTAGPSRTVDLQLVGAASRRQLSTIDAPQRLITKYGTEASQVAALDLPELVSETTGTTAAEVVWAVRHEGALDADDVLDRRTRIGLVDTDRAAALPQVRKLIERSY
jgi:glycerol-3-phosphate dehydrogenase